MENANGNPSDTYLFSSAFMTYTRLLMQLIYIIFSMVQFNQKEYYTCNYHCKFMYVFSAVNCIARGIMIINNAFFDRSNSPIIYKSTKISKLTNLAFIFFGVIYILSFNCPTTLYYFLITYIFMEYIIPFMLVVFAVATIYYGIRLWFSMPIFRFGYPNSIKNGGAIPIEIARLPIYKYIIDNKEPNVDIPIAQEMHYICNNDLGIKISIDKENAICPICFDKYDNNTQLRYLCCSHHYHQTCLDEWIKINSSCPICRIIINYN